MTKAEQKLINKALRWLAADRTPTVSPEDNFAECGPFDELVDAIEHVCRERGRPLQSYYSPEPLRALRRRRRARHDELMRKRDAYEP